MKKIQISRFTFAYMAILIMLAVIGTMVGTYQPHKNASTRSETKQYFTTDLAYYDLPRISMNIPSSQHADHINLDISLEVSKKDVARLEDFRSRITDHIITYMYEQNVEKIRPPSDIAWLHRDLLKVINTSNQPVVVHDILFRELIVM